MLSESPLRNGFRSGLIVGLMVGPSAALIAGLSHGLITGLAGGLVNGLVGGLLGGSLGGLGVGSLKQIDPVETMSWRWNRFWKRSIPGLIAGLMVGLIVGLLHGLNALNGLRLGLVFGLTCGVVSGMIGGFTDTVKAGKVSPNQGVKLSRQNALVISLVCLPLGLIWGLVSEILVNGAVLRAGLAYALLGGLVGGLNRGGSAFIKHYALRLVLWLNGYTPLNFIKFLDHCAKLILLKKVGGGYIFVHRMLLEYFADLTTEPVIKSAVSSRDNPDQ